MLDTKTKEKPFAWSFSKLKNYETCPRRYEFVDVLKKEPEGEKSPELARGDELHDAMRKRVEGMTPLPPQFIYMEKWAAKLSRILHPLQIIRCEEKLALDRAGNPTGYFDRSTWLRAKLDYYRYMPDENGKHLGHIVDYKTGKPPAKWDGTQLLTNAYVFFAHIKTCVKVRVDYLWTEWNDTTHETYTRDQIPELMAQVTPRVMALEDAHRTNTFEPKPCGLCREYCPVTYCEYWGKGLRK